MIILALALQSTLNDLVLGFAATLGRRTRARRVRRAALGIGDWILLSDGTGQQTHSRDKQQVGAKGIEFMQGIYPSDAIIIHSPAITRTRSFTIGQGHGHPYMDETSTNRCCFWRICHGCYWIFFGRMGDQRYGT